MKRGSVTRGSVTRMRRIDEDSEHGDGDGGGEDGNTSDDREKGKAETSPLLPKPNVPGNDTTDDNNGVDDDDSSRGSFLMPWAFQSLSTRIVPSPFDESSDEEEEINKHDEEDILALVRSIQLARHNRRRIHTPHGALASQSERLPEASDWGEVALPEKRSQSIPAVLEVSPTHPPPPPPAPAGGSLGSPKRVNFSERPHDYSPAESQDLHKHPGAFVFVPPEYSPSSPTPHALSGLVRPNTTDLRFDMPDAATTARNPYHKYLSARPPQMHKQHPYQHRQRFHRSIRRRIFLLLTEPQTSILSAVFFAFLIIMIATSNVVMMMQTMDAWQYTPDECVFCGGSDKYYGMGDDFVYRPGTSGGAPDVNVACVCPPLPTPEIVALEDWLILFFAIEWTLRVICFAPPTTSAKQDHRSEFFQWLSFLREPTTILDALAIFPYYLERFDKANGLLSLRLLRLFRVFQLVRLGKYNVTFLCLMNVLVKAFLSINLLIVVLLFGAAFFGSIVYWLEKGEWRYTTQTDPPSFAYVRTSADGFSEELSPFTSIPSAFWWFMVTVTTVGYGDTYPTTVGGKLVAGGAMLLGLLVIAFPVSVFSDLWSKELKNAGALGGVAVEASEDGYKQAHENGAIDAGSSDGVLTAILQRLDRMEETQAKVLAMLEAKKDV